MYDYFRKNIVEYALLFLNKKYTWGSIGPDEFDCSGFTYYVFKKLFDLDINNDGYGEGDTTKQMTSNIGILRIIPENKVNKDDDIKKIKLGDLLFFHRQSLEDNEPTIGNRYPGHVGIYLDDNKFIHASFDAKKIIISELDDYWKGVLVATKDIVSDIKKTI